MSVCRWARRFGRKLDAFIERFPLKHRKVKMVHSVPIAAYSLQEAWSGLQQQSG